MNAGRDPRDRPVTVPIASRLGRPTGAVVGVLVLVVVLGVVGRLVPRSAPPSPQPEPAGSGAPVAAAGDLRLISPFIDALYIRTTEVAVRGRAPVGVAGLEALVVQRNRVMGQTVIPVADGRFGGVVTVVPPVERAPAFLEVRDAAAPDVLLVELPINLEAGALLLPKEPSRLRGTRDTTLVVDVLLYEPVARLHGLLSGDDGVLIAEAWSRPGSRGDAPWPRTVGLPLQMPDQALPARARLHLIALDRDGMEIEHVDSNVVLTNR